MYDTALVRNCTVTSNEDVIGNCLTEDFDFEDVSDDFFCLAVDVRVNKGDVVVAGDYVPEGG